jgi:signal transduction histidine kinase
LQKLSELDAAAHQVNVVGNDVFATRDAEAARRQFRTTLSEYEQRLEAAHQAARTLHGGQDPLPVLQSLADADQAMQSQTSEADSIFAAIAAEETERAAEHMAAMDRHNAALDLALSQARGAATQMLLDHAREQREHIDFIRGMEYVIASLLAVVVISVTAYAVRLSRAAAATMQALDRQHELERDKAAHMSNLAQIATGVAHELRNPLTSIKLLVQSARREDESGGLTREDLDIVHGEIARMERTMNAFLLFARPPRPRFAECELQPVLRRTLELVETRARQHLDTPGAPLLVSADCELLQQLFLNLALNALDALPRGGRVVLTARAAGGNIEVAVVDNGPGIDAAVMPRLFEPFVTTKDTGMGLGLGISRRIAREHGGDLRAENLPGGGARFALTLPRTGA